MSSTEPLMKCKVAELRAQLESRGLDSKGTKPTLVERLREAINKDGNSGEADVTSKLLEKESAEKRPETPRKSRRLSGNIAEERPETPTRKSRRLSENNVEERPETPTIKCRRLSGNVGSEDRPATPTRKSRRLSGGLEPIDERPMTPTRKSRRLSGAGEESTVEKEILLEDQLENLGTANRRVSVTARNKRISQLGGSAITTIPEVPEKENTSEAQTPVEVEGNEAGSDNQGSKEIKTSNMVVAPEVPEGTEQIKNVKESDEKVADSKKSDTVKLANDKENLPMEKVLDNIIVPKTIPRQKPKSGKFWKEGRQQFRQIKRDKGKKFTFEQRMKNKEEKMKNKELADLLLSRKAMKKEEIRKKIEENKARKLENEKKSEQFQVIKNPAKIKRMKKKQLRMLEKRDIVTV